MALQSADLYVYMSEQDARAAIEESYPGAVEAEVGDDEDILLEHQDGGKVDMQFQLWEFTHPKRGPLWIVNAVSVVDRE